MLLRICEWRPDANVCWSKFAKQAGWAAVGSLKCQRSQEQEVATLPVPVLPPFDNVGLMQGLPVLSGNPLGVAISSERLFPETCSEKAPLVGLPAFEALLHLPPTTFLVIENPGVGKSTILNGLLGGPLFRSGLSFGRGMTYQLDIQRPEGQPHALMGPGGRSAEHAGGSSDKPGPAARRQLQDLLRCDPGLG